MSDKKTGKVWLVGAGPSDPGLLTVKGKQVLEQADVVVYDRLVGPAILLMMPEEAEKINVGKISGNHPVPQDNINEILLEKALEGKKVVRLKGGDPFVFGRGGEELELLVKNQVPFEIVPGVTAAAAVPAYEGIPVTHRDFASSLHLITAHKKRGSESTLDFDTLSKLDGTLVFYMGLRALGSICDGLMAAGMSPEKPAAVIEKGTSAYSRRVVSDLAHLEAKTREANIVSPALIVVGEVCSLSDTFAWKEELPLGKTKVIVTRPKKRSRRMADALEALGAEVVLLPAISTVPLEDTDETKEILRAAGSCEWIGFTSAEGVDCFFDALVRNGIDIRSLYKCKFAAIGPATAKALKSRGILDILMPSKYTGNAMGNALLQEMGSDERILLPRAKKGTEEILKPLNEAGISYTDLPMYDTITGVSDHIIAEFVPDEKDLVTFTSASTVNGFAALFPELDYTKVNAVCIGEQTAKAAEKLGMKTIVSAEATIDSMVEKIKEIAEQRF